MYSYHKGGSVYITILGCNKVIFPEPTRITARIPVSYGLLCLEDSNENRNLQPRCCKSPQMTCYQYMSACWQYVHKCLADMSSKYVGQIVLSICQQDLIQEFSDMLTDSFGHKENKPKHLRKLHCSGAIFCKKVTKMIL